MDVFLEQIVAKKRTSQDVLKTVGIILAAIILIFAALFILPAVVPFLSTLGLFLVVGILYGTWYLLTSSSVEYEYILTNGEIDVDKIIARRKRKRLITVNTRNFTEFGPYRPQEHAGKQYTSTIYACVSPDAPNTYYAVTDHPKYGHCMLVFNPNEKILTHAKQYMNASAFRP
ncbi:MAG: DUF6106 family protein [Massiliimalia sp.]|jgi:hypothetical protein